MQVFIDGEGFPFRFVPELPQKRSTFEKRKVSKQKDDDQSDEEEEDENDKLTEWEKEHKKYEAKLRTLHKPEESGVTKEKALLDQVM